MSTSTPISVFPSSVPVFYVPLPDNYPKLPVTQMNLQPVAYNQGISGNTWVTVLVPLGAGQIVVPASVIIMDESADAGATFTYTIDIVSDDNSVDIDRLALMSFSFLTHLSGDEPFKVVIEVKLLLPASEGLGKVVMDSNMDPTFPQ